VKLLYSLSWLFLKKTSKSNETNAKLEVQSGFRSSKALSLGKSILSGRSKFVYPTAEESEEEE